MDLLPKKYRASEIYGDYWFNSDPIAIGALHGYVVLINFWDYTCTSSLRALPYIEEWHRRYADKGLATIGVHTPEFPFARDPLYVKKAIERLRIKYPVVMDNDYLIWSAFRTAEWPTRYLIDKEGFIRVVHAGEGFYQNFEHSIQSLLTEAGYHYELPLVMDSLREADRPGAVCYRMTPKIFGGFQRGSIGNVEGSMPESTTHFEDPGYYLEGRIYLHGNWLNNRSFFKLNESESREGYLVVSYQAKEVNVVVKPEGEKQFQAFVQQDDQFLTQSMKGDDIEIDAEGRSYFLIREPKLFNIVKNQEFGEHKLKLSSRSNGLAVYSISFVSSAIPETISKN